MFAVIDVILYVQNNTGGGVFLWRPCSCAAALLVTLSMEMVSSYRMFHLLLDETGGRIRTDGKRLSAPWTALSTENGRDLRDKVQ